MLTVELLERFTETAKRLNYRVRQEWLGGSGGGACEFGGQRWIFIDLALSTSEQLHQISEALRDDPRLSTVTLSVAEREHLNLQRRVA